MKVVSLASGSSGNAYLVGAEGQWLLIDCGIGPRIFAARLKAAGLADLTFAGLLVTHCHTDHTAGISGFCKHHPDVPVYANYTNAETLAAQIGEDAPLFACFENGQTFEVGPFRVKAFSIPHDIGDPVGFLVSAEGLVYFHGTDIGTPLDSIGAQLASADVATLESNHDPVLLRTSQRPDNLKQRISGPRGHLSNDEAAALVRKFASPRLRKLSLAHLSGECNTPRRAEREMREALAAIGRSDVELEILAQDAPSRVCDFA